MKIRLLIVAILLLIFMSPVFSQMMGGDGHGPMMGEGDMGSMMGSGMRRSTPIRSEQDYINQMIPHHAEAMDAAILVFATTADQEIRTLTQTIFTEQSKEIVELKVMYADQFSKLPPGDGMAAMMRDLERVSGKARDVQFIQDMIPHHQGAVTMSQELLAIASASDAIKAFARKVIRDQNEEIKVMQAWLAKNR